jgi:CDP-glucose 4,6-dehydratase
VGLGEGALEALVIDREFWRGRRVFITGHTGFKGAWLTLWLSELGARVTGYSLPPPTDPSLFEAAGVARLVDSIEGDIRDLGKLRDAMVVAVPEVVFHLAAQALVRRSYAEPIETFSSNVMGTVNVLEALRACPSARAAVIVTSDKCYENRGLARGYVEDDPLGGHDPYSSSKACAEIVAAAYRRSFFDGGAAIATARAGNVIGGGDWAEDRLVPDMVRAFLAGRAVRIRNPDATRPWQHVLDPLAGYLLLAERLCADGPRFAQAWNFGPGPEGSVTVRSVVEKIARQWGPGAHWELDAGEHPHEARVLALDPARARRELGWTPRLGFADSVAWTVDWYRQCTGAGNARAIITKQMHDYMKRSAP